MSNFVILESWKNNWNLSNEKFVYCMFYWSFRRFFPMFEKTIDHIINHSLEYYSDEIYVTYRATIRKFWSTFTTSKNMYRKNNMHIVKPIEPLLHLQSEWKDTCWHVN